MHYRFNFDPFFASAGGAGDGGNSAQQHDGTPEPKKGDQRCKKAATIAEDVAAHRALVTGGDVGKAASSLNDVASIAVGGTQSLLVSAGTIRGTISYTGFDGVQRSYAADVRSQGAYLRNSAGGAYDVVRNVGRSVVFAGGAFAAYDVAEGVRTGNDSQVFNGVYNGVALAAGLVVPPLGIGLGIAKVADDVTRPRGSDVGILDSVPINDTTCL